VSTSKNKLALKMKSVRGNIVINFLGQGWAAFMALAFLPLYIDKLGMEAYGLIGIFVVMQSLFVLLDMGMTPTLNREMARFSAGSENSQYIRDLLYSVEVICYSLAFVIVMVIWFASDYLARDWIRPEKLNVDTVRDVLLVMAFVIALRFCEGIYRGALYGLDRLVWYSGTYALLVTLRYAGAIAALEWVSRSIEVFFLWQAAISFLTVAVLMLGVRVALPKAPSRARFSHRALVKLWKFAGGVAAITFLGTLLLQTDRMLLSRLVTLEEFGNYTLAAAAASVLFSVLVPVMQVAYPRMVLHSTSKNFPALIFTYRQTSNIAMTLTSSAAMLLILFSGGIIFMWSGNGVLADDVAELVSVLALGNLLNCLAYLPHTLQLVYGRTGVLFTLNVIAVIVLAIAISWVVPRFGSLGAAWTWVALNAAYALVVIQSTHRTYLQKEQRDWLMLDVLLPVGIIVVVTFLAFYIQPVGYLDRYKWFLFLLLTGIVSFLAALVIPKGIKIRLSLINSRG
jgi:O-antigen/teichoic acid export membrane protein